MVREYLPEEYTKEDRDLIKVFQQTMNELELAYLKAIHSNDTIKANTFLKKIKGVAKTLNDEYSDRADIRITEEYLKGVKYLDEA
jgi:DNA replicative helicase MCM subunit Mcm2 (Cdc46/Mcm family)